MNQALWKTWTIFYLFIHPNNDAGSDEELSNDDNATKAHTLNNHTEDFDDNDEWW